MQRLQPEDFPPRRRDLHAVRLWERPPLEDALPEPGPEMGPGRRAVLLLVVGAALAVGILLTRPPQQSAAPETEPAAKAPAARQPAESLSPPVYRRLTDEELKAQLPPGAIIIE